MGEGEPSAPLRGSEVHILRPPLHPRQAIALLAGNQEGESTPNRTRADSRVGPVPGAHGRGLMIQISLYSLLGKHVVSVDYFDLETIDAARQGVKQSLAYLSLSDPIAHDEENVVERLVGQALAAAHQQVSERGGWSGLI